MSAFEAGVARRDITPDESVPMAGGGPVERWSTGVRDPLYVTALVLDDGDHTIGIASLDLIWIGGNLARTIRDTVTESTPLDDVLLAATHTHSGPFLPAREIYECLDHYPASLGYSRANVESVIETIRSKTLTAFAEAFESRSSATIRVGTAETDGIQLNRRSRGGLHGDVDNRGIDVDPETDVDPEIVSLHAETANREAILYNYALHSTTMGGTELSADWPRVVRRRVHESLGGDAYVVFLNGAAGDIVPAGSYDWRTRYDSREEFSNTVGSWVADAVAASLDSAKSIGGDGLSIARHELDLDLRSVPREAFSNRIKELVERIEHEEISYDSPLGGPAPVRERYYLEGQLAIDAWDRDTLPITIRRFDVGETGILSLPGEPTVRYQLDLKDRASIDPLMVAGYTDGAPRYLPTPSEFERGGYEGETCIFGRNALESLRTAAFNLVDR